MDKKLNVEYKTLTEEFIRKNADRLNWSTICKVSPVKAIQNLVNDYSDEINWNIISTRILPESFIREHESKLSWMLLMRNSIVDIEHSKQFFVDFGNKINWEFIVRGKFLTEEFIEKHQENLDWLKIVEYQRLSEKFIRKHLDKLDFKALAKYQILSQKFITEFSDVLPWYLISENQKLSKTFIKKNKDKIVLERLIKNFNINFFTDEEYREIIKIVKDGK